MAEQVIKKEDNRLQRWIIGNIIFLVVTVFGFGAWVKGVEKDITHVKEQMEIRTEDRFYRQDGLILEQRIVALENNYQRIETALVRLDEKLEDKH